MLWLSRQRPRPPTLLSPTAPGPPQSGEASGSRPSSFPPDGFFRSRPPPSRLSPEAGTGGGRCPCRGAGPNAPSARWGVRGTLTSVTSLLPSGHPLPPGDGGPGLRGRDGPGATPVPPLPATPTPGPRPPFYLRRRRHLPARGQCRACHAEAAGSSRAGALAANPPCRTRWRRPRPPLSRSQAPARRRRRAGRPKRRSSGARRTALTWSGGRTSSVATASTATSLWPSAAGGPGRSASTGRTAPSWPPPPSTSLRCSRGASLSRARAA